MNFFLPVVRCCQAISIKLERFFHSLSRQVDGHQLIKNQKVQPTIGSRPSSLLFYFLVLHPPLPLPQALSWGFTSLSASGQQAHIKNSVSEAQEKGLEILSIHTAKNCFKGAKRARRDESHKGKEGVKLHTSTHPPTRHTTHNGRSLSQRPMPQLQKSR